jgi:hypothetical protein
MSCCYSVVVLALRMPSGVLKGFGCRLTPAGVHVDNSLSNASYTMCSSCYRSPQSKFAGQTTACRIGRLKQSCSSGWCIRTQLFLQLQPWHRQAVQDLDRHDADNICKSSIIRCSCTHQTGAPAATRLPLLARQRRKVAVLCG